MSCPKYKRSGKKKSSTGKRLKAYVRGVANKLGLTKEKKSKTKYQRSR